MNFRKTISTMVALSSYSALGRKVGVKLVLLLLASFFVLGSCSKIQYREANEKTLDVGDYSLLYSWLGRSYKKVARECKAYMWATQERDERKAGEMQLAFTMPAEGMGDASLLVTVLSDFYASNVQKIRVRRVHEDTILRLEDLRLVDEAVAHLPEESSITYTATIFFRTAATKSYQIQREISSKKDLASERLDMLEEVEEIIEDKGGLDDVLRFSFVVNANSADIRIKFDKDYGKASTAGRVGMYQLTQLEFEVL